MDLYDIFFYDVILLDIVYLYLYVAPVLFKLNEVTYAFETVGDGKHWFVRIFHRTK